MYYVSYQVVYILLWSLMMLNNSVLGNCYGSTTQLSVNTHTHTLNSPNYPLNYNANSNCKWLLRSNNRSRNIRIEVKFMDLEYSQRCMYDHLIVYDGMTNGAPALDNICGTRTPTIESTGSDILLEFHSDWGIEGRGFTLEYTLIVLDDKSDFKEKYKQIATIIGASIGGLVITTVLIYLMWFTCQTFLIKTSTHPRRDSLPNLYHTPSAGGEYVNYPIGPPPYEYAVPNSPPPPYVEVDSTVRQPSVLNRLFGIPTPNNPRASVRRQRRNSRRVPSHNSRLSMLGGSHSSLFNSDHVNNNVPPSCIIVAPIAEECEQFRSSGSSRRPTESTRVSHTKTTAIGDTCSVPCSNDTLSGSTQAS